MQRKPSRIRAKAALALAITAVAAPAAYADGPSANLVTPDARDAGRPVTIDRVTPDARDAARPAVIDRVSPDARDNGRREPAPVVISQPAAAAADGFDWLDAGIGAGGLALLLVVGTGAATTFRTHRAPVRAA
jgi:hypothetical protein